MLMKDENSCRNDWPFARVIEVSQSSDNQVRSVKLQVADTAIDRNGKRIHQPTVLMRPIRKPVVLFKAADK